MLLWLSGKFKIIRNGFGSHSCSSTSFFFINSLKTTSHPESKRTRFATRFPSPFPTKSNVHKTSLIFAHYAPELDSSFFGSPNRDPLSSPINRLCYGVGSGERACMGLASRGTATNMVSKGNTKGQKVLKSNFWSRAFVWGSRRYRRVEKWSSTPTQRVYIVLRHRAAHFLFGPRKTWIASFLRIFFFWRLIVLVSFINKGFLGEGSFILDEAYFKKRYFYDNFLKNIAKTILLKFYKFTTWISNIFNSLIF